MKAVLQTIRILVIVVFIDSTRCHDEFSEQDLLRLQQYIAKAENDGQTETITSYSANMLQRDPNAQSLNPVSAQYQTSDTTNKDQYDRAIRGRSKKVYRIKNPFQRQMDEEPRQPQVTSGTDSDTGASNQYAAMQYSLPPEEFLQQMRAENQYYQQQISALEPQASTPAPSLGYTVTPQPQYQYSTIAASGYDSNNQQPSQLSQMEQKISQSQSYRSIASPYQFNSQNTYGLDSLQSSPTSIPPYLSTASNNQYVGTPANTYVSSSSPIFLSSPTNLQQYVSSPLATVQAGVVDYTNKGTSTIGSNSINYDSAEKKMLIDHYDNAANGMRYQPQYQSEYPSSTPSPSSTPYPDPIRDSWQNTMNAQAVSKSLQEMSLSQYPKYPFGKSQQESKLDQNTEADTHRIANLPQPSANNVYLNFVQPDYQALQNLRIRTREPEQEASPTEFYSHGEYGWKMSDKKPQISQTPYAAASTFPYQRYQTSVSSPDAVAVSQMSFHMDTGKQQPSYEHIPNQNQNQIKSSNPEQDAQDFAKAAAKAHENMRRQQYYGHDYSANYLIPYSQGNVYGNEKQKSKIYGETGNSYIYGSSQPDFITANPYYFNSRDNGGDDKPKQPFDHDKVLKNIVPIDVSNVVNENHQKLPQPSSGGDNGNKYSIQSYNKDQFEQNLKHNFKTITDSFYQDKNSMYALNIRPKPEEVSSDGYKLVESSLPYYNKQHEQYYSQSSPTPVNYVSSQTSSYQDSLHSSANVQPQGVQRPQNPTDISSILKLNDIPYRITQNLPPESFRSLNNNYEPVGLPTPLPLRLNQNVQSHQLDVAAKILNNLVLNKQPQPNRPDQDPQSNGMLSTINGFKVANPYNVDLNLVADVLKGRPTLDENRMLGLRDQYAKPNTPIRLDISQLQQLLRNQDNHLGFSLLNDGLGAYSSPYIDIYNSGRYPYQGVKYSRSQEEEETIVPIADASNNHPIGAVIESDEPVNGREIGTETEPTAQDDDHAVSLSSFNEETPKHFFGPHLKPVANRHHPNSISPGRFFPRKHPKDMSEPYPLLKPPPIHSSRSRNTHKIREKHGRRRRVKRPRVMRIFKTEPLFEAEGDDDMPTLLRPPPVAEAKSDVVADKEHTPSS